MSDRDGSGRFQTGGNGGPGRPKGSRNRLSEGFLQAMADDFEAHGPETIRLAREADPVAYLRVCASLMPRHHKVETIDDLAALSDGEIAARIRDLDHLIAEVEGPDWLLRLRDDRGDSGG